MSDHEQGAEQAQSQEVTNSDVAQPVEALQPTAVEPETPTPEHTQELEQQQAPARPQLNIGSGTVFLDPFNISQNGSRIADIVGRPNQFVMFTGANNFIHTRLYAEEVEVLSGILARVKNFEINNQG